MVNTAYNYIEFQKNTKKCNQYLFSFNIAYSIDNQITLMFYKCNNHLNIVSIIHFVQCIFGNLFLHKFNFWKISKKKTKIHKNTKLISETELVALDANQNKSFNKNSNAIYRCAKNDAFNSTGLIVHFIWLRGDYLCGWIGIRNEYIETIVYKQYNHCLVCVRICEYVFWMVSIYCWIEYIWLCNGIHEHHWEKWPSVHTSSNSIAGFQRNIKNSEKKRKKINE